MTIALEIFQGGKSEHAQVSIWSTVAGNTRPFYPEREVRAETSRSRKAGNSLDQSRE